MDVSMQQWHDTFYKQGGDLDMEKYMKIVPDFYDVEP